MKRILVLLAALFVLPGHNTCTPHTHEPPKPNVLLLYTDDQPTSAFTAQYMPITFREIVNKGVNFSRSYASVPVCCPDRAGTYSGNWGHNTGVAFNGDTGVLADAPETGDTPNGGITAFDWSTALPKLLDDAGYHTALFGKVMNDHEQLCTATTPPATCTIPDGFDRFVSFTQDGFNFLGLDSDWYVGSPTGAGTAADYYYNDDGTLKAAWMVRDETPVAGPFDCEQEKTCHNVITQGTCDGLADCSWDGDSCEVTSCTATDANDYSTDLVRDLFLEWIDTVPTGEPWFAAIGFYAPHFDRGFYNLPPAARHDGFFAGEPIPDPPSFDESDVSDKPSWVQNAPSTVMTSPAGVIPNRTNYWQRVRESLLSVDEAIFEMLATLDQRSDGSDTIIIFVSDNGYLMGEHGLGMKNLPYEESARVPMAVRWLDKRPPSFPETSNLLVSNIDIAPTCVAAASISGGPSMDGADLTPIIDATVGMNWRTTILSEGWWPDSQNNPFPSIITQHPDWAMVVRSDGWKYVDYDDDTNELYDLTNDPFELQNEIGNPTHATTLSELQSSLATLRAQ